MQKFVHTSVILASVVVLAAITAGCARQGDSDQSSSITGPSSLDARGGGGKKGGGGTTTGTSNLTLVMVTDNNGNGTPNWGDTVTFSFSTTVTEPTIDLVCSQNGVDVYGATAGFYDSFPWPWTKNMILSSSAWSSGAADCTATLHDLGSSTILGTLKFTAGA
jgi:hypothetical protein